MNVSEAPAQARPGGPAEPAPGAAPAAPPMPEIASLTSIVNGEQCGTCADPSVCATGSGAGAGATQRHGWGNDAPVLNAPALDPGLPGAAGPGDQTVPEEVRVRVGSRVHQEWRDHLGREFDFILEHFPEEPGPREQIIPHNPLITRELAIEPGEVLIGRPLGISCGCPITHCGIVQSVDTFTGAMVWCVTGPLHPRQHGFKDIGYYSAQAYEGLITNARIDVEIGRRYWFQPRMCMMQWRHSGLVNFLNRGEDGLQARIEGLWIG